MSGNLDTTSSLHQVYERSLALFATLEQEELFRQIVNLAEQLFATQILSIMLKDPRGDLYIVKSQGLAPEIIRGAKRAVGEGIAGRVFLQDAPLILHGQMHADPGIAKLLERKNITSSLIAPLKLQSHPMGVINLARINPPEFIPHDADRVALFARIIAQAIENANLHQQLSKFSDQHLAEAYRKLQVAYDELQKTQHSLLDAERLSVAGKFAASLAHEIRNPLSIIKSSTQFLLKKYPLEAAVKERLEVVQRNAGNAEDILNELLNLAKPEANHLFAPVALHELLDHTFASVEPKYRDANLQLVKTYATLPMIQADAKRLQRVFLNFAVNAFDALKGKGTLTIGAEGNTQNVIIRFTDTGEGVPPEVLAKLGQPFTTTKKHGIGLGLYLAKQTIEAHGGTLSISSQPPPTGGTIIAIQLPIHHSE